PTAHVFVYSWPHSWLVGLTRAASSAPTATYSCIRGPIRGWSASRAQQAAPLQYRLLPTAD
ncbi:MAG: hypothetical protein M3Z04_15600, partial [Chloroflexota bacterium]|nr:hypothetical protein [Chloroflexota bacterium]